MADQTTSIADLRKSYERAELNEEASSAAPGQQFSKWLEEAIAAQLPEPNAMTLATSTSSGKPSARIVLLKECDNHGFVFFTNYDSRKGRDLAQNSEAALLFFWAELERQIRIEGRIEKVSVQESEDYFVTRPLGSRLGAIASPQSEVLASRDVLQARFDEAAHRYGDQPQRPPHWGGYRLIPQAMEFWQGRPSRLHDRLRYRPDDKGNWTIERLAP